MRIDDVPYRWRDLRGEWVEATGLLYRPDDDPEHPLPLVYFAGYEADAGLAAGCVEMGAVLVTPRLLADDGAWPHGNPLGRGLAMDEALLRVARALPVVDDTRVIITGGSAGGYMTLMLSAATFPLAGAFPTVPPVNLPYLMSVWLHSADQISALRPDGVTTVMAHPGSPGICGLRDAILALHGDPGGERMWQWSPLAHLSEITCPVITWVTSADALVPVPQFGGPLAAAAIAEAPDVYPIDPDVVATGALAEVSKRTLLSLLDPDEVQVFVAQVPEGSPLIDLSDPAQVGATTVLAPPRERRWMIGFLDEGGITEDIGHLKHLTGIDTVPLMRECLAAPIEMAQLTPAKLDLLIDRYLGRCWVQPEADLDLSPEELVAEQEDVRRGLRTYCAVSPAHRAHFEQLWARTPPEVRAQASGLIS